MHAGGHLLCLPVAWLAALVSAESGEAEVYFDEKIAPVLSRHCVECHQPSDAKGDIDLTTRGGAAEALVAGDAEDSELWLQVADDSMPKKRPPLSDEEKRLLREWIDGGAVWSDKPVDLYLASSAFRAGYDWWSLQAVKVPPAPEVKLREWVRDPLDGFILEGLERAGLQPAPRAELRVLARRVSYDLTGLPPDPEAVAALERAGSPEAYEAFVDGLLASPAFGEHWARRWLDVIRFGESQGFERNRIRENAWRFRDWVVQAFNDDLPYDDFVRQQIAGDVLRKDDLNAWIATGFHVAGTWDQVGHQEGSEAMRKVAREEHLEDLVGTLGQTFLGLSVQCARCHDHKYDPIPQADYFRMAALIGGVRQLDREREGMKLEGSARQPEFRGVAHVPHFQEPGNFHILARGNPAEPGAAVEPGALTGIRIVPGDLGLDESATDEERRKRLAEWLTRPDHPLTARVMVNRLWHHVFGAGLVMTPSDFGLNGGLPSHPGLLDQLASDFVESGWKVKAMIRRMVTSSTYQQMSAVGNEKAMELDGGNRLLWRAPMRRLAAEEVRDAMLMVAGVLDRKLGGPSFRDVEVKLGNNHEFTTAIPDVPEENRRRTVYRLWANSGGHPFLESLDCAAPGVAAPRRTATITPLQALSMLNDPLAAFSAERFAGRLRAEAGGNVDDQLRRGWELAMARQPSAEELADLRAFAEAHGLEQACLVIFNSNEFVFLK